MVSFCLYDIHEGEVLAVWTEDGDLLVADSFDRKEFAVYPDVFSNVTMKDYTFRKTYRMDEVIYMKYGNEKLTKFMNGMFQDYNVVSQSVTGEINRVIIRPYC